MVVYVLACSILLQLSAAIMAMRLIPLTGKRTAWSLIAAAISLMAIRRMVPLYRLLSGDMTLPPDLANETLGLFLSFLMAIGIARIAPLFRSIKQAKEVAEEAEKRYRSLFDHANDAILLVDPTTGTIHDCNPQAYLLTGYTVDELRFRSYISLFTEDDQKQAEKILSEAREHRMLHEIPTLHQRHKTGTLFAVETNATLLEMQGHSFILCIGRDVTERERTEVERLRLEGQLSQSQKMESVGRLAGGVAHDFNNMLAVILGHGEMMMDEIPESSALRDSLDEIMNAGERAKNLTQQLLAFSRKQVLKIQTVDLNTIVLGIANMLRRILGEDIELQVNARSKIGYINADTSQVEQILMNLCVNARDAMPNGGTLLLETESIYFGDTDPASHSGGRVGHYVMLCVSDTGTGMDEATLSRIFDPFFTTKEKGKGTGLGLATVFGIVKQHFGEIWVYSEVGCGTTFKIIFPQEQNMLPDPECTQNEVVVPGSGEYILVVEDEEAVRKLVCHMLERQGYHVIEAQHAEDSLKLAQFTDRIDLMVSDVIMPEMNGRQVFNRLREIRPDLKALFMSGYTEDIIAHQGILDRGLHFISKPFSEVTLSRKVREALEN